MPFPHHRTLGSAVLLLLCVGCVPESYKAKPLNSERAAAAYVTRDPRDADLQRYMQAHGTAVAQWPPARWGLDELTLLAFYFHPDLRVAREEVNVARAALAQVRARAAAALTPRLEHHGERRPEDDGPWSLGFEFEMPLAGLSRRAARAEGGQLAVERAQLAVGGRAWRVRADVRAALLGVYAALREGALAEQEVEQYDALVKLLQRRLKEGVTATGEVTRARLRANEARADIQARALAGERALGDLSLALGLPLEVTRQLPLSFTAFDILPAPPAEVDVRASTLLNRIDVRDALLAYAVAESEVKLEVARQYPEWSLLPGFQWDQGDAVWSLGLGVRLPAELSNARGVRLAQARRELAAREFERLQAGVLARGAAGANLYRRTLEGLRALEAHTVLVQQRLKETESLFSGGYADRLQLVEGRIEGVGAARAAWSARRTALQAWGELEDTMQVPLTGGPLPAPPFGAPAQAGRS